MTDFATAPFWISLNMRKIVFSFFIVVLLQPKVPFFLTQPGATRLFFYCFGEQATIVLYCTILLPDYLDEKAKNSASVSYKV
jgi:hypothetical protein